jgi:hypothetical protein
MGQKQKTLLGLFTFLLSVTLYGCSQEETALNKNDDKDKTIKLESSQKVVNKNNTSDRVQSIAALSDEDFNKLNALKDIKAEEKLTDEMKNSFNGININDYSLHKDFEFLGDALKEMWLGLEDGDSFPIIYKNDADTNAYGFVIKKDGERTLWTFEKQGEMWVQKGDSMIVDGDPFSLDSLFREVEDEFLKDIKNG